jgi:excisionase family DNA binding protein
VTVNQAAKKIGVSASKLYQLVSARKIAHYRVGGKIVFSDDDIAAFLAGCRVPVSVTTVNPPPAKLRLKHLSLS